MKDITKSKHPSLIGLKGLDYRKAWNKLFREKCRAAEKRWREKNPEKRKELVKEWRKRNYKKLYQSIKKWRNETGFYKKCHDRHVKKHGISILTRRSRETEKKATMRRQLWGVVEDDILMSGKYTESQLVEILGRSIRAIQRRKWRIRQEQ